jgi:hypothetical protein
MDAAVIYAYADAAAKRSVLAAQNAAMDSILISTTKRGPRDEINSRPGVPLYVEREYGHSKDLRAHPARIARSGSREGGC